MYPLLSEPTSDFSRRKAGGGAGWGSGDIEEGACLPFDVITTVTVGGVPASAPAQRNRNHGRNKCYAA